MKLLIVLLSLLITSKVHAVDEHLTAAKEHHLASLPCDVLEKIVVFISQDYSLDALIALFTSSKSMLTYLHGEKARDFFTQVAYHNQCFGFDQYVFDLFIKACAAHKFTMAPLLLGYGGIVLVDDAELLAKAHETVDEQTLSWLASYTAGSAQNE